MSGPKLTVLNYSGGTQSTMILWQLLRGERPMPSPLLVLNANPGMECSETYRYITMIRGYAAAVGIDVVTVPGPNLLDDLLGLEASGKTRLDSPPYWTLSPGGSRGRLVQKCTRHYKVAPMDRYIRAWLERNLGISAKSKRIGEGTVLKWIGFTVDEQARVKASRQKYVRFDYPLIRDGVTREDVAAYYVDRGIPAPPRSVCNACFANTAAYYAFMKKNRVDDWNQAVAVDESVRDWSQIGVDDPVYVCRSMLPLAELSGGEEEEDVVSCDAGYCFL